MEKPLPRWITRLKARIRRVTQKCRRPRTLTAMLDSLDEPRQILLFHALALNPQFDEAHLRSVLEAVSRNSRHVSNSRF
ncbi:MAG: hypothetical protein SFY92_10540 [Verrucomicrobiae bacterium]|nr:hypothetical protein [Verrucomicrobiae bacterium]